MATVVKMPAIVADANDAVVAAWNVSPGDTVSSGQVIAEIETEKATVEFESEAGGTVARLLAEPGVSVLVGDPIAVLAADGDGDAEIEAALAEAGVGGSTTAPSEKAPVEAEAAATPAETAASDAPGSTESAPAEPAPAETAAAEGGERRFASPLARRLAKELGLSLEELSGSGPGGRIIRSDVEAAAEGRSTTAPAPDAAPTAPASQTAGGPSYVDEPLTGMRRAIARAVTANKATIPHFYVTADVRIDELLQVRARVNETLAPRGLKASVNDFVLKALGNALALVPEANASFQGDAIRRYERVDIAVAMATESGLLMPVVADVAGRGLASVCEATNDLKSRASNRGIKQDELEGGSFALSNLGMYGVREFSAIINAPHAGILAVGAGEQRPVVVDGEIVPATVMTATISADHRVIDGAAAAQLLQAFKEQLEDPFRLLI